MIFSVSNAYYFLHTELTLWVRTLLRCLCLRGRGMCSIITIICPKSLAIWVGLFLDTLEFCCCCKMPVFNLPVCGGGVDMTNIFVMFLYPVILINSLVVHKCSLIPWIFNINSHTLQIRKTASPPHQGLFTIFLFSSNMSLIWGL